MAIKKPMWEVKTKIVYDTKPKQFWCNKCRKSSNIVYFDGQMRYCPECFEGKEEDYEVIEEFNKGGWKEIKEEK